MVLDIQQNRIQEALNEFMKSLELKKEVIDIEFHPEFIRTLNCLGAVNATLGNYAEARDYFREALRIARANADPTLGDNDPRVYRTIQNLEKVDKKQNDHRRRPQAF